MKRVDTKAIIERALKNALCFLKGHAWLTPKYGTRVCNRCELRQHRGPKTDWQWVNHECIVKDFNPCE